MVQLVQAEHGTVLADVLGADVAAATFADSAFHPQLQGGVNLVSGKAHLLQAGQNELDHNRRTADQRRPVHVEAHFLQIVRHEAHVAVPALLGPVNGQMDVGVRGLGPDLFNLPALYQIVGGPGAVEDIHGPVVFPVVQDVVDDGPQGRQADAAGDE